VEEELKRGKWERALRIDWSIPIFI
jgi:hypothetical protein